MTPAFPVSRKPRASRIVAPPGAFDWAAVTAAPIWLMFSPLLVPIYLACYGLIAIGAFVERSDDRV